MHLKKTNLNGSGNFKDQKYAGVMDFTRGLHAAASSFTPPGAPAGTRIFDRWNVPAVCIDVAGGSSENLCDLYHLPGVPYFPNSPLVNIEEISDTFDRGISETKAENCAFRTELNFAVSMTWAYGIRGEDIVGQIDTPVASDRDGAWIKALELALRMRNLENMVNREPIGNLCIGGGGCTSIGSLEGGSNLSVMTNERPIKAFLSAWRNLSGERIKKKGQINFLIVFV